MPSIKKLEYEGMKNEIKSLRFNISAEQFYSQTLLKMYKDEVKESEKWKRYYEAVRETLQVEAFVEIPSCFNPMDAVEYVVKKQEEV